jgi:Rrf2 family protein
VRHFLKKLSKLEGSEQMRLSTRARYAFHCMLAVHRLEKRDTPATAEQVAKESDKPKRYLEQIIHLLKKDALLISTAGRKGGYRLARPADQIKLSDVVRATVGSLNIVECVLTPETCDRSDRCEFRLIYLLMTQSIYQILNKYTLADLDDDELLGLISRDLEKQIAASAEEGVADPLALDLMPARFREKEDQKL